jgi:flagellar basal-body rod modification protein FlgD
MPEIGKSQDTSSESLKNRYLQTDKSVNVRDYLQKLEKEEKSGLKGIEVRDKPKQLGKDDFLKLLITQLSKQDPTNPMKDQDFIAQMAQFSSLEQMKNISTGIQKLENRQSYSLVGKVISGPDFMSGETVVGVVGAVFFDNDGKVFARVNGKTVEVDKINFISDPEIFKSENQNSSEVLKENSSFLEKSRSLESENSPEKGSPKMDERGDWDYPGSKTKRNAYDKN